MKKSGTPAAAAIMLLSSVFWGVSFVSMELCYTWFTPIALLKYRLLISAAALALIVLLGRRSFRVRARDLPRLFICGALGVFVYYLCEMLSIRMMSASSASVMVGAIPIASLLATALWTKTRLPGRATAAALLSTAGIAVTFGLHGEPVTEKYLLGLLLMLAAILSWVIYGFLSVDLMGKYDGIVVTFYQIAAGALLSVLCFPTAGPDWSAVGGRGIAHLIFLGAVCSGVCYLFYNRAVRVLNVTVTNTLMNLVPLFTILTEIVVYRRPPQAGTAVGGALIVGAAMLAVSNRQRTPS